MCFNSFKLYFQYHGWSNPWFFLFLFDEQFPILCFYHFMYHLCFAFACFRYYFVKFHFLLWSTSYTYSRPFSRIRMLILFRSHFSPTFVFFSIISPHTMLHKLFFKKIFGVFFCMIYCVAKILQKNTRIKCRIKNNRRGGAEPKALRETNRVASAGEPKAVAPIRRVPFFPPKIKFATFLGWSAGEKGAGKGDGKEGRHLFLLFGILFVSCSHLVQNLKAVLFCLKSSQSL